MHGAMDIINTKESTVPWKEEWNEQKNREENTKRELNIVNFHELYESMILNIIICSKI